VLRRYGGLTREALAAEPVDLVIWPRALQTSSPTRPTVAAARVRGARGRSAARGRPRSETERHYNSALLLAPGGSAAYYDKVRLLPFVESHPWRARGDVPAYSAGRRRACSASATATSAC